MQRITIHVETVTDDIHVGDIIFDEAASSVVTVERINVSLHSVQVFGKRVITAEGKSALVEGGLVFVDGDTDVWLLKD
jgi:hypothetical protein